jgi:hypothetical protein
MKKWLRRIRGAVGMGLTWALVWAPIAVLIGMAVDPDGSMDEMWPAIGAYPGFLGGVVFSVVLAIAARRRRLEELSIPRVAAWGAAAGLLVGALPFTIGESTAEIPLWQLATVVIGSITLLSAVSAAGSLALATMAERRALAGAGADVAGIPAGIAPFRTMIRRQGRDDAAAVNASRTRPVGGAS